MKNSKKNSKSMDERYMELVVSEAKYAKNRGDYAFGAAIVQDGRLLVSAGNRVRTTNDSTRHVEIECVRYAVGLTKDRYIPDATLYTTTFPCMMCLGATYWSGIRRIVYGIDQNQLENLAATSDLPYRPCPFGDKGREEAEGLGFELIRLQYAECAGIIVE